MYIPGELCSRELSLLLLWEHLSYQTFVGWSICCMLTYSMCARVCMCACMLRVCVNRIIIATLYYGLVHKIFSRVYLHAHTSVMDIDITCSACCITSCG